MPSSRFLLLGGALLLRGTGAAGQATSMSSGDPVYQPAAGSERPSRIDELPLYREFYDEHHLYRRAHVLLEGIERKAEINTWWKLNSPEAYVVAQAEGSDTGSTDYFEIGSHKFGTREASREGLLYSWDKKAFLIYKVDGTEAIKLTVYDEDTLTSDDILMDITVNVTDLPQPGEGYVAFRRQSDKDYDYSDVLKGAELLFKIKVTDGADRVTSKEDLSRSMDDIQGKLDYGENVLELSGGDRALLQSWRHTGGQSVDGAVLWIIGRNDCYMHPHVLEKLFYVNNDSGEDDGGPRLDVYVLNWRENGLARHRGWVTDSWLTSHCESGNFDAYLEETGMALELMRELGNYNHTVGYAHSTGVPLLLNWILKNGEDDFDAFVFNAPFLDWANVGGDLQEFALEKLPGFLSNVGIWENDRILMSKDTPDAYKDDPIEYLQREVVPSSWHGRYFSQHYVEWTRRTLYSTAMTVGFAKGANNLLGTLRAGGPIISDIKPTLVLASLSDDIVDADEMEKLSEEVISKERRFVPLPYNYHDVFLSGDEEDTMKAISVARQWLTTRFEIGFEPRVADEQGDDGSEESSSAGSTLLAHKYWNILGFILSFTCAISVGV